MTYINIGTNKGNFQRVPVNKPFTEIQLKDVMAALKTHFPDKLPIKQIHGWCEYEKGTKVGDLYFDLGLVHGVIDKLIAIGQDGKTKFTSINTDSLLQQFRSIETEIRMEIEEVEKDE